MPAKKGSKKKGSSSTGGAEAIPFKYEPPDLSDLVKPTYCCCRVCNCNGLPHLNFEWPVVETNVTLAQIKDAIRQRHGGTVTDIILYRGALHPDKSLSKFTDGATLLEAGFEGALRPIADDVPVAKIVYEFPSQDRDEFEPILATSGTLCTSKYGLSQKAANAFMAGSKSKCK